MRAATTARIAVHVHSDWSYDGSWPLADLARAFAERRYQVILMAEHDRGFDQDRWGAYQQACDEASSGGVLLVPGIEYSDRASRVHLPVWGELPFLGEGREMDEVVRSARSHGGVAILAHPGRRRAWEAVEPEWMIDLLGVEAWNGRYGGLEPDPAGLQLLAEYPHLVPFADLDFHQASDFHPLAMQLELSSLTPGAVYEALAAGRARPDVDGRIAGDLTKPHSTGRNPGLRAGPVRPA